MARAEATAEAREVHVLADGHAVLHAVDVVDRVFIAGENSRSGGAMKCLR